MRDVANEDAASGAGPNLPDAGFTLVESLIALTLGGLVVMGALSLFTTQQGATSATELRSEVHQGGRYVLDILNRDLARAGQGMDPTTEFAVVASEDGGGGSPDRLYAVSVDAGTPSHVLAPVTTGFEKDSLNLKITCGDPVDDIEAGDLVYVAGGTERGVTHVLETQQEITDMCSGGDPETKVIGTLHASVTVVDAEQHGWIFEGNSEGHSAMEAQPQVYYFEQPDDGSGQLVRATDYLPETGAWDGGAIVEGVEDFQVRLILTSGDTVDVADATDGDPDNDYDDIDTIIADLQLESRQSHREISSSGGTYAREYTLNVTPRNQMYSRNLN